MPADPVPVDAIRVWRICRAVHAAEAFSGEGARRFGGRWNSRGVPMAYASTSLALAAIELFVHLEPNLAPDDLMAIRISDLPPEWRSGEPTRGIGDEWIGSRSSLALRVPSAPIPREWNILINPLHPRMAGMTIDAPEPFVFDERMFR